MTFTHLDDHGKARMVDVNTKATTLRTAIAIGEVVCGVLDADVEVAARVAGTNAAKQTSSLIPLCHPIPVGDVAVVVRYVVDRYVVEATVNAIWKTGVEMEALTAVSIASLTLAAGAPSGTAVVGDIAVQQKSGGKSGTWGRAVASC